LGGKHCIEYSISIPVERLETFSPVNIEIDPSIPPERISDFLRMLADGVAEKSGTLRMRADAPHAVDAEFVDVG
jgi:hypothetical protein